MSELSTPSQAEALRESVLNVMHYYDTAERDYAGGKTLIHEFASTNNLPPQLQAYMPHGRESHAAPGLYVPRLGAPQLQLSAEYDPYKVSDDTSIFKTEERLHTFRAWRPSAGDEFVEAAAGAVPQLSAEYFDTHDFLEARDAIVNSMAVAKQEAFAERAARVSFEEADVVIDYVRSLKP